jgi:hypothetical protein
VIGLGSETYYSEKPRVGVFLSARVVALIGLITRCRSVFITMLSARGAIKCFLF